jgi:hypothetical protein
LFGSELNVTEALLLPFLLTRNLLLFFTNNQIKSEDAAILQNLSHAKYVLMRLKPSSFVEDIYKSH